MFALWGVLAFLAVRADAAPLFDPSPAHPWNRLYDALACGAFVISDHIDGIESEFQKPVTEYPPFDPPQVIEAPRGDRNMRGDVRRDFRRKVR